MDGGSNEMKKRVYKNGYENRNKIGIYHKLEQLEYVNYVYIRIIISTNLNKWSVCLYNKTLLQDTIYQRPGMEL